MVFAILLVCRRFIVVQDNWIKTKNLREITTVFSSPNKNAVPDFTLEEKYLFDATKANVYSGFALKQFGNFHTYIFTKLLNL